MSSLCECSWGNWRSRPNRFQSHTRPDVKCLTFAYCDNKSDYDFSEGKAKNRVWIEWETQTPGSWERGGSGGDTWVGLKERGLRVMASADWQVKWVAKAPSPDCWNGAESSWNGQVFLTLLQGKTVKQKCAATYIKFSDMVTPHITCSMFLQVSLSHSSTLCRWWLPSVCLWNSPVPWITGPRMLSSHLPLLSPPPKPLYSFILPLFSPHSSPRVPIHTKHLNATGWCPGLLSCLILLLDSIHMFPTYLKWVSSGPLPPWSSWIFTSHLCWWWNHRIIVYPSLSQLTRGGCLPLNFPPPHWFTVCQSVFLLSILFPTLRPPLFLHPRGSTKPIRSVGLGITPPSLSHFPREGRIL